MNAPTIAPAALVGVHEIAERANVKPNTVNVWRRRHSNFPKAVATLAIGQVWNWSEVEAWLSGRASHARV